MSEQEKNTLNTNEVGMRQIFCSLLLNKDFSASQQKSLADGTEVVLVDVKNLVEAVTYLKMHKETQFSLLYSVTGTDYPDRFELLYHLQSIAINKKLILKVHVDKNIPEVDSLAGIFSTADWHEREVYDLLGVKFNNHPDLRRILMPDDWKGHPLRKDYVMDDERLNWNER